MHPRSLKRAMGRVGENVGRQIAISNEGRRTADSHALRASDGLAGSDELANRAADQDAAHAAALGDIDHLLL